MQTELEVSWAMFLDKVRPKWWWITSKMWHLFIIYVLLNTTDFICFVFFVGQGAKSPKAGNLLSVLPSRLYKVILLVSYVCPLQLLPPLSCLLLPLHVQSCYPEHLLKDISLLKDLPPPWILCRHLDINGLQWDFLDPGFRSLYWSSGDLTLNCYTDSY